MAADYRDEVHDNFEGSPTTSTATNHHDDNDKDNDKVHTSAAASPNNDNEDNHNDNKDDHDDNEHNNEAARDLPDRDGNRHRLHGLLPSWLHKHDWHHQVVRLPQGLRHLDCQLPLRRSQCLQRDRLPDRISHRYGEMLAVFGLYGRSTMDELLRWWRRKGG